VVCTIVSTFTRLDTRGSGKQNSCGSATCTRYRDNVHGRGVCQVDSAIKSVSFRSLQPLTRLAPYHEVQCVEDVETISPLFPTHVLTPELQELTPLRISFPRQSIRDTRHKPLPKHLQPRLHLCRSSVFLLFLPSARLSLHAAVPNSRVCEGTTTHWDENADLH
jgi:hypothetical protein